MRRALLSGGLAACFALAAVPAVADLSAAENAYRRGDYATAAQAFAAAAETGDAEARTKLAIMHLRGEGMERDPETAVKLLQAAADDGYVPAQFNLGRLYYAGIGVGRDRAIAADWFTKAAESGDVLSAHVLSVLYFDGEGVDKDLEKAAGYARRAADAGLADAQYQMGVFHFRGAGVPKDLGAAYFWFILALQAGGLTKAEPMVEQLSKQLPPETAAAAEQKAANWQRTPPAK